MTPRMKSTSEMNSTLETLLVSPMGSRASLMNTVVNIGFAMFSSHPGCSPFASV